MENFLIQCGKVENSSIQSVENIFFPVLVRFFATIVATPLLLMDWKGYGFFRARLKKVTDFLF